MTASPLDYPAGRSTGARRVQDPPGSSPLPPRKEPGGTTPAGAVPASPVRLSADSTAPDRSASWPGRAQYERARPGQGQALRGEEWRKAAKAAQTKSRRKTTRPAASKRPILAPPPPGQAGPSAELEATAHCNGCQWTTGPGPAADVDKAAEKHVRAGHPTAVTAELGGAA